MNEAHVMATLTGLAREIHQTAVEHGWWDCETCGGGRVTTWAMTTDKGFVPIACPVCNGPGEHRNVGELLALVHSEVSEALEAKRSPELDWVCDKCDGRGETILRGGECESDTDIKDCAKCGGTGVALAGSRFAEELADVLIRLLDIAGGLDVDIAAAVIAKLRYNETRPRRHGKSF